MAVHDGDDAHYSIALDEHDGVGESREQLASDPECSWQTKSRTLVLGCSVSRSSPEAHRGTRRQDPHAPRCSARSHGRFPLQPRRRAGSSSSSGCCASRKPFTDDLPCFSAIRIAERTPRSALELGTPFGIGGQAREELLGEVHALLRGEGEGFAEELLGGFRHGRHHSSRKGCRRGDHRRCHAAPARLKKAGAATRGREGRRAGEVSLEGERGVALDVEQRLETLEGPVPEALHAAEIGDALEAAVLLPPGHDPLGLCRADGR